ncbi:hypothetical protein FSP39_004304 [Pinctada imbricata]|uniref:Reverse transcriptase domain-containing protein n=1 Tax=Pinctada imbricata TaxID=66713 RepID=A0AA89BSJ9_PINIB|nr:hypothetical protein FSP39_004304 [Pinctada imbricata]
MRDFRPDILGIAEVKPKNSANKPNIAEYNLNEVSNFNMFSKNVENDTGRGILLYVNAELEANEIKMDTPFEENLFVNININIHDKMLVGIIYRSESGSDENNSLLNVLITEACEKGYRKLLIMGDFNYPNIDWDTWFSKSEVEYNFISTLQDNYLYQAVHKPTRWRGNNRPNILDLLISNEEYSVTDLEYSSPLGKSDHCVISFSFECHVKILVKEKLRKCYQKADFDTTCIKTNLRNVKWEELLKDGNMDDVWDTFLSKMNEQIDKYVPTKKIKSGTNAKQNVPLDKEILSVLKKKKSLARKCSTSYTTDQSVRREYCKVRNKVKSLVRKAKRDFEHNISLKAKENPKVIWRYINSKSKTRVGIGELCKDPTNPKSEKTNDDREKANILARYFTSVFTKEPQGDIPTLPDRPRIFPMSALVVEKDDDIKMLGKLRQDKSPGLDCLHPMFLKELSEEIAIPLQIIFNKSLQEKEVPSDWRKAKVSAIFTKGEKSLAGNYRPVSLTSFVRDHIVDYMSLNQLFTKKQYGFMSGRSTALQLLSVLEKWTNALDEGNPVDCIYMDFQKAFDTVPHRRLISKLKSYGIDENLITWISSFLSNR